VDRENLPAAIAEGHSGSLARKCPKIKKRSVSLDLRRDAWLAAACDAYVRLRPMPEMKQGGKAWQLSRCESDRRQEWQDRPPANRSSFIAANDGIHFLDALNDVPNK
jgi:hypothetical protein